MKIQIMITEKMKTYDVVDIPDEDLVFYTEQEGDKKGDDYMVDILNQVWYKIIKVVGSRITL
jgi:hypothetical protein